MYSPMQELFDDGSKNSKHTSTDFERAIARIQKQVDLSPFIVRLFSLVEKNTDIEKKKPVDEQVILAAEERYTTAKQNQENRPPIPENLKPYLWTYTKLLEAFAVNQLLGENTTDFSTKSPAVKELLKEVQTEVHKIIKDKKKEFNAYLAEEDLDPKIDEILEKNKDIIRAVLKLESKEDKNSKNVKLIGGIFLSILVIILAIYLYTSYKKNHTDPFADGFTEEVIPPPLGPENAKYMWLQVYYPRGEDLVVPTDQLGSLQDIERQAIEDAFAGSDSIQLQYGSHTFSVTKADMEPILAANTCPGHGYSFNANWTLIPLQDNIATWDQWLDYVKVSVPLMKKVLDQTGVGKTGSTTQKMKDILALLQDISAENNNYALDTYNGQMADYCSQPWITLFRWGLKRPGLGNDCEDNNMLYGAALIAAGIPETNIIPLWTNYHEFMAVVADPWEVDGTAHIRLKDGSVAYIVEPTLITPDKTAWGKIGQRLDYPWTKVYPIYSGQEQLKVNRNTGEKVEWYIVQE